MSEEKNRTFEEALKRLEEVLSQLEGNNCSLEQALDLFQEGMQLVMYCRGKLSDVEGKISILLKESGDFVPFTDEEEH